MSKNFRDLESLGKSAGKKWSQNCTFLLRSGLKSPHKKSLFFADFALQNLVETRLPDGLETSGLRVYQNFGISLDVFEFFCFGLFFPFLNFFWFLFILGPPYCGFSATIRIGREIRFLPYAGFFMLNC